MIGERLDCETLCRAPGLRDALLQLNNESAAETSFLDAARFEHLVAQAFVALHVPAAQAILIALDQDAAYDSPNFAWFADRYDRFVYVDRIVVASSARGRGLARALYEQLFDIAQAAGHTRVTCEVNADPPNPASDAFHGAMGFREVGRAQLKNGKTVRYFERLLGPEVAASANALLGDAAP